MSPESMMNLPILLKSSKPKSDITNLRPFCCASQEDPAIMPPNVIEFVTKFIRGTRYLHGETEKDDQQNLECLQNLEDICSGAMTMPRLCK